MTTSDLDAQLAELARLRSPRSEDVAALLRLVACLRRQRDGDSFACMRDDLDAEALRVLRERPQEPRGSLETARRWLREDEDLQAKLRPLSKHHGATAATLLAMAIDGTFPSEPGHAELLRQVVLEGQRRDRSRAQEQAAAYFPDRGRA